MSLPLNANEQFLMGSMVAHVLQEHQLDSRGVYSCQRLLEKATTPSGNLLRMDDGPGYPSSGSLCKIHTNDAEDQLKKIKQEIIINESQ